MHATRTAPLLYRVLLRLLPRRFRARHGAAMEETFAAAHADASSGGRLAVAWLYLREGLDLLRTGARLRLRRTHHGEHDQMSNRADRPVRAAAALMDDIIFGVRSVRRHGAFFAFAALTLGFGVGATTAM